jgi:hypothetical protein
MPANSGFVFSGHSSFHSRLSFNRCRLKAPNSMKNPVSFLRSVALLEAISYLVLLFIAMPLKYALGMPMAVKIVGSVHGGCLWCSVLRCGACS